jgi:peptide/nickel transport system permease protein
MSLWNLNKKTLSGGAVGKHIPAVLLFINKVLQFIGSILLTFLGLTAVTFFIGRVMPIDPVVAIVGDRASSVTYERVKLELGLDKPLYEQYWKFLTDILQGDLGISVTTSQPVLQDILHFFPATWELATIATIIGVAFGVPMGVFAATHQGRWLDHLIRFIGLIGYSIPIFWLGMVGLLIFYAKLDWVSGPGRVDFFYDGIVENRSGFILIDAALQQEWEVLRNAFSHIILPASLLGYYSLAYIARMTRSFMLEQLSKEYIITARVKGMSERRVVWKHALGNTLIPLVTVIVLSYAYLLEGSVLTETIFAWPGIGLYITNSLFNADMNAVLGGTIVVGCVFVGFNLLSDLIYILVDPRARL